MHILSADNYIRVVMERPTKQAIGKMLLLTHGFNGQETLSRSIHTQKCIKCPVM